MDEDHCTVVEDIKSGKVKIEDEIQTLINEVNKRSIEVFSIRNGTEFLVKKINGKDTMSCSNLILLLSTLEDMDE